MIFAFHGYPWLVHRLTYRRTQPRRPARARLQGERHHDDAVRHGDAQRPRPLPPRHRRDRPGAGPRRRARPRCARSMVDARLRARGHGRASTARTSPRSPTGPGPAEPCALLTVNAGSTSIKVSVLDADGDRRRFETLDEPRSRGRAARRGRSTAWCTVATRTEPVVVDDERASPSCTTLIDSRRCTSRRRSSSSTGAASRGPTSRSARASTPRSTRRSRRAARTYALPAAAARAGAWSTGSTASRTPGRRVGWRARRAGRTPGRRRAPRWRRVALRGARRPQRRDHDGLHARSTVS